MPDVMASAGCRLVEVGTTNRTHAHDYERRHHRAHGAADEGAYQQLRHPGLHRRVAEAELAPIAAQRGLPLATDLGSGALVDLRSTACRASRCRRRSSPPAAMSSPSAATSCWAARRPG
jgi:seryl-tRNA(Sec) selenium transferase